MIAKNTIQISSNAADLAELRMPARIIDRLPYGTSQTLASASGTGYEITQPSRYRRAFGLIAGMVANADRHLTKHTLGQLREMCRMHDRQSSLFSGLLDRALDNIFGANFDFIPSTGDSELNKKAKDYIHRQMERDRCDAAGVMDFAQMGKTTLRAVWNDGDCLMAKQSDGTLMAFEADQIETPKKKHLDDDLRIVMGVELNRKNKPVAYHIQNRGVRGDFAATAGAIGGQQRVRADSVLFPAYRKRFGQTRGLPFLAAILGTFDRTNNYLDYEQFAAEQNSMLGWKITRSPSDDSFAGETDNDDYETAGGDSTYEKVQKMERGMIFDLLAGEDVNMLGAVRPGENFEPYIVTCCRIIGVGVGMPLELLTLDFSKTNYSSARASLGEARRMFRVWQKFGQTTVCVPWYSWQITRGIATGELPARNELYRVRCQWPAWEYIEPVKEAKGNEISISTRTKSISQCIREGGGDPDEVFDEIEEDNKKLAERNISLPADKVLSTEKQVESIGRGENEDETDEDESEDK